MNWPRFLVGPELAEGVEYVLDPDTYRHVRALRLRPGDRLVLTDGRGAQRLVALGDRSGSTAKVQTVAEPLSDRESPLAITLCLAPTKQERTEWAVEKATELGVRAIIFVRSTHASLASNRLRLERLERVAEAALEQCQRRILPRICGPVPIDEALERTAMVERRILLWEGSDPPPQPWRADPRPRTAAAMIGPEGGWSAPEVALACSAGWEPTALGPRVLRAETAAITAAVRMQALWGDLG